MKGAATEASTLDAPNRLSDAVLDAEVDGVGLASGTLRDQLSGPTLIAFLRHFGCPFCREMVADLRDLSDDLDEALPVLFVYQNTPEAGAEFFRSTWPEARAVADPERCLYEAFGVGRAGVGQALNPGVWACTLRAVSRGHLPGVPDSDPRTMPGLFIVGPEGAVAWSHDFAHAADHPDFRPILRGEVLGLYRFGFKRRRLLRSRPLHLHLRPASERFKVR